MENKNFLSFLFYFNLMFAIINLLQFLLSGSAVNGLIGVLNAVGTYSLREHA